MNECGDLNGAPNVCDSLILSSFGHGKRFPSLLLKYLTTNIPPPKPPKICLMSCLYLWFTSPAATADTAFQTCQNHFLMSQQSAIEKRDKMSPSMMDVSACAPHFTTGTFLDLLMAAYLSRLIFLRYRPSHFYV